MDWTIFLQVTLPMAAGFGWLIHRMDRLEERISKIDARLSRLEGKFDERGHWEGRLQQEPKES